MYIASLCWRYIRANLAYWCGLPQLVTLYEAAVYRAGGEDKLCDTCRPQVLSYGTVFGVGRVRKPGGPSDPTTMILLVDAITKTDACWHCGWLVSIARKTWYSESTDDITSLDPATKLYVNWHRISKSEKDSRVIEGAPQINRLVISCSVDTTAAESRQVVFSKSVGAPMRISSLMDQHQALDWVVDEPYSGRIRPSKIDYRLLSRWKECCIAEHSGTCDQTFMTNSVESIRFVDVVDRCIVKRSPDNIKWVALSYCWGGPQLHALQTARLNSYQKQGSLTDDILPKGIADAMSVTHALGERFIWIDSLCIIQDDEKDKLKLIAAMGTIYAHAVVTIVNAANSQVDMGIPGISSPRRAQQVHQMKDFWLVESLDLPHAHWQGYLRSSHWNTRGWTFQEGLLSPRCLILGKDQVYWQCKTASWCEDSCWEKVKSDGIYRHYSGSNILGRLTNSREEDWIELYKDALNAYTIRELTSESDRLGAVQAILEVLRRSDEEDYFWGMPQGHMEMALCWATSPGNTRRECLSKLMGPNNEILSSPFPSWSWLGWHGNAPMPTMNRALLGGRLGLKFYRIAEDGTPVVLNKNPFRGPERDFTKKDYMKYDDIHEQYGYPRGLAHHSIRYDEMEVKAADIPQSVLRSQCTTAILCFWTSTVTLNMKYEEGWAHYHNCPKIALSWGDVRFYAAWGRYEDFKPNGPGKFLVVGTERLRMSRGGYITLNLLLVNQDEEGISYRHKLVTSVEESVWEKIGSRKWELVFLA
ncbi:HET-domain-containing protein [Hypomontagnella submonticulosa]|nr:HET-domain-containing protein [Hypomontagnella submonticulosa]